jgi:STE24 endopeptidase
MSSLRLHIFVQRLLGLLALFFCFAAPHLRAQSVDRVNSSTSSAVNTLQSNTGSPSNTQTPRQPTQSETDQYRLSRERYDKAVSYSRAGYTLYFISYFLSAVVLLLILRLGVAARFRDITEAASDRKWIQCLVFVSLLLLLTDLFELPVRVYWHALSLRYQQSIQHWGSWIVDWAKEEGLSIALAVLLVFVLTVAMRKSPRRWWFYFWLAALPILLFFFFISPWFIDPLFNHFEPLAKEHPQLVSSIERLTQRAGVPIPRDRMFLMRASEKTNAINAYVTGIGASKRVVIWDTTIQKTSTDETLFILGHELGHYVLGHIAIGFTFFALALLLALYVMFRALHWSLQRWGAEWKIYGPEDLAAIAVLFLWLEILSFISSPIANGFSRMQEHAADVYGLEVIHGLVPNSDEVAAHGFQVMGELDLSDPNPPPFITFWLYSHPPLAERLIFAHAYDPWSKGEPPKYVK